MKALLLSLATSFVELFIAVHKAGDDKDAQEEALMQHAERVAELREKVKFG